MRRAGGTRSRRSRGLLELVAENVDRLVNLDISGYGVIRALYEAARAHHGRPLTLLAAERLRAAVRPGDRVLLTSGWVMPGFYPAGETDGPIGAAALARALALGLGARPIILTEESMMPITAASCRGAGVNVLTEVDMERAPRAPHPASVHAVILPLPIEDDQARKEARRLFDQHRPKAVIAIEKNGPNRRGVYHMVGGFDNSDCVAKAGRLFEEAGEALPQPAARRRAGLHRGDAARHAGDGRDQHGGARALRGAHPALRPALPVPLARAPRQGPGRAHREGNCGAVSRQGDPRAGVHRHGGALHPQFQADGAEPGGHEGAQVPGHAESGAHRDLQGHGWG